MRLTCEAILFDMDGTLVDSTAVVERAWARWAERYGLDLSEILSFSHGRPTASTMQHFRERIPSGIDLRAEAIEMEQYEESRTDGIVAVPGAAAAVEVVRGGLWGIVTSAPRRLAESRLRAANLEIPEVLIPADEIRKGKPDPEGFLKAASLLHVSPQRCVVFEDTSPGLVAARAAGMTTVGLLTTFNQQQLDADFTIRDFNDVRIERHGREYAITYGAS